MERDDDKDKLVQDLLLQNQKLMALVAKMRGGDEDDKTPKAKIPPRRKSRSITKPLRRSPRRHAASPAASPRTPAADGAALRKRLSFGGGGGGKKSPYGGIGKKKKRTPATPQLRLLRKALGDAIKANMDGLLLSQFFRDERRFFKLDEFEEHVVPIMEMLEDDEEIDTSFISREQLFRIAVDVAKKRERYTPRKNKLNLTKKRRLRKAKEKKRKLAASAAAGSDSRTASSGADDDADAGADAEAAHAGAEAKKPKLAASAAGVDAGTASSGADDDADAGADAEAAHAGADADSDGELRDLIALDGAAQKDRAVMKEEMVKEKAAEKARAFDDYKKKMAAAAVAASKIKSASAKKGKSAKKKTAGDKKKTAGGKKKTKKTTDKLRIGLKVQGWWPGEDGEDGAYYNGVIQAIDYEAQTVHIVYEDGDFDDAVPWAKTYIQDEETSHDG